MSGWSSNGLHFSLSQSITGPSMSDVHPPLRLVLPLRSHYGWCPCVQLYVPVLFSLCGPVLRTSPYLRGYVRSLMVIFLCQVCLSQFPGSYDVVSLWHYSPLDSKLWLYSPLDFKLICVCLLPIPHVHSRSVTYCYIHTLLLYVSCKVDFLRHYFVVCF